MGFPRQGDLRRLTPTTLLGWVVMAFAIYSGLNRHNFEPSDAVSTAAPFLAGLVCLFATVAYWRSDNPDAPHNNAGLIRGALAIVCFAACAFVMSWMATFGASAVLMRAATPELAVRVGVVSVYPEGKGKGCHYRLELHTPALSTPVSPCVSEELWRELKPGDTITLVIAAGSLGTQILDVRDSK